MDRFIVFVSMSDKVTQRDLKSNMDRFIVAQQRGKNDYTAFKIQYG